MANMTDQNRVNWFLQAVFTASVTATFTPGIGGGSAIIIKPPYNLRLMQTMGGSNVTNNTELGNGNGYTTNGASMGSSAFAAPSGGISLNSNVISWSASGSAWSTVNGIEIWDTSGTPLRWLQGSITPITGVVSGDTVSFAAGSISINASQWLCRSEALNRTSKRAGNSTVSLFATL